MTLTELARLLPSGIGVPTLSNYETGATNLHVSRMNEICVTMGVSTVSVLAAALRRAGLGPADVGIAIDLHSVLAGDSGRLVPLRQWAKTKLVGRADSVTVVEPGLIRDMAAFCGLSVQGMAAELERYAPSQSAGWRTSRESL